MPPSLRAGLDANVLIAGIRLPRWPHEVLRAALVGAFRLVLPEQVIVEAQRHLMPPAQEAALQAFLDESGYEELPMPSRERVRQNLDVVRSAKDVPIALALLDGNVGLFVTNDRDFSEPTATAPRFREQVRIMLPAVFLRDVLGWSSDALEAIRHRTWEDLSGPNGGEAGRVT
ncbi:MAG: type II toxin-antitoxin system VapC family toxin [Chloroflexota bacterium]|nr:type II toxin-antitoxin system VapC family toxin [Chloroflexota bacterium]